MGFPQTDFGSLVQALYGIEEGIARGLWADSSPQDSKGKNLPPTGGVHKVEFLGYEIFMMEWDGQAP